ncbi:S1 RNA-binding domain-containing protein [Streptomyces sp. NPDC001980]|uniref:S1 RNA-binding domain-containing protein n=1 Tax=Streptomyces sp. NPDC001980 TaxID=3157126 RepID=UPI00331D3316
MTLDGSTARTLGWAGVLDGSWRRRFAEIAEVGQRVTAEVMAVDMDEGRVRLSMAATENPELWAFLKRLRRGEFLAGTVASIEPFGVFVQVADGLEGLVQLSELSSVPVAVPEDVVQIGDQLTVVVTDVDRVRRRLSFLSIARPSTTARTVG